METALQALLVCSDERVVRVLRRVLTEMDIEIDQCGGIDVAIQKLTRQRYQSVVVDCTTSQVGSQILRGTRSALANKRAVTVAVLESEAGHGQAHLKEAFEHGAHFVLFKPLAVDRVMANFRAVRALMKRERRRYTRIPIEVPVDLIFDGQQALKQVVTTDLGENGMAVKSPKQKLAPMFRVQLTLPGTYARVECRGEVAWESNSLIGIRFCDVGSDAGEQLRRWMMVQLTGNEAEEPAVHCRLTDLSLCACYLETESPFPLRTRLNLIMKVGELELRVEGIVRVMHPEAGMGVEFTQDTAAQRAKVEEFIHNLVNTVGAIPELQVRPESIETSDRTPPVQASGENCDPLLGLFLTKGELTGELFQAELRRQRRNEVELEA